LNLVIYVIYSILCFHTLFIFFFIQSVATANFDYNKKHAAVRTTYFFKIYSLLLSTMHADITIGCRSVYTSNTSMVNSDIITYILYSYNILYYNIILKTYITASQLEYYTFYKHYFLSQALNYVYDTSRGIYNIFESSIEGLFNTQTDNVIKN